MEKTKKHNPALPATTAPPPGIMPMHPKYRLAELLRAKFGEFGVKQGTEALAEFCGIKRRYTINDWINIPAGSDAEISHLLVFKVQDFFDLKSPDELITPQHKCLLKTA